MVRRNEAAVDTAVAALHQVPVPESPDDASRAMPPVVSEDAPEFVRTVTAAMMSSAAATSSPSARSRSTAPTPAARRPSRSAESPISSRNGTRKACIQCGNCAFVCPHSVIRSKYYDPEEAGGVPDGFPSAPLNAVGLPGSRYTLQVYVEDCTGWTCVETCPVTNLLDDARKAINLVDLDPVLEQERDNIGFFETLPQNAGHAWTSARSAARSSSSLFEFSGACAGCMRRRPRGACCRKLFGERGHHRQRHRLLLDLRRQPADDPMEQERRRPRPGMVQLLRGQRRVRARPAPRGGPARQARRGAVARGAREEVGTDLADAILEAPCRSGSRSSRPNASGSPSLSRRLADLEGPAVADLRSVVDHLLRRSLWIVGGDGMGLRHRRGGLDHVLASGRDVNVLVLDTEVYSNTGGQSSKATPLAAVAKFAAAARPSARRTLPCRRSRTGTSTSLGSPWAPTHSRR